jgi:hypothetical protein
MERKVTQVELVCDVCVITNFHEDPAPAPVSARFQLRGREHIIDLCVQHAQGLGHRVRVSKAPVPQVPEPKGQMIPTSMIYPIDGRFTCPDCDRSFGDRRALGAHRYRKHGLKGPRKEAA